METTFLIRTGTRRAERNLAFAGYLQLAAGVLTLACSTVSTVLAVFSKDPSWLNPLVAGSWYGVGGSHLFMRSIAGYMAFQFALGWIFGILMTAAGILSLMRKERGFVTISAIFNLFNFPHGTAVSIVVLHGIARRGISGNL